MTSVLDLGEPAVQLLAHLVGGQLRAAALVTGDDDTGGGHPGQPRDAEHLPELHREDLLP